MKENVAMCKAVHVKISKFNLLQFYLYDMTEKNDHVTFKLN